MRVWRRVGRARRGTRRGRWRERARDLRDRRAERRIALIQMAVAFVTRHPAVTSAIIGLRIRAHLDAYLAADGIELPSNLVDRIDQIVPPGVTINVADNMWNIGTPALSVALRRR